MLTQARAEMWQALRYARDLRRRGRVQALPSIPRKELLLTMADESDYDPAEAIARRCVSLLMIKGGLAARIPG